MPIFRLQPVLSLLDDPVWQSSSYRGTAWANTPTSEEARRLMSGRFEIAAGQNPAAAIRRPSPWMEPRLVVAELASPPAGMHIPAGSVMTERAP